MKRAHVASVVVLAACAGCGSCRRDPPASREPEASPTLTSDAQAASSVGAPRPGMAWIPPGTLRAGTPPGRAPRVPDEEMPGTPIAMEGFYIDVLPWPNEPNAIPTSNVSREEAEQHCASKGKRLCTELEWERACKGPDNSAYEYGDTYRAATCGTGVALEQAARRPTGEHPSCKSGFGVAEMHGGVWEWTSSAWGRSSKDAAQGVLRGGNSVAGELVGRCANAIARSPSKKSPTMGLRCCAGPRNAAEVKIELKGTPGLVPTSASAADAWSRALGEAIAKKATGPLGDLPIVEPATRRAWRWTPVPNEELVIAMGCASLPPRTCAVVVGGERVDAGESAPLASIALARDLPELSRRGDARHLRIQSLDNLGLFSREITYAYGRVDIGEQKRP